jgi:hypothetical protein
MSSATSLSLLMERSQTRRQHDYSTGALATSAATAPDASDAPGDEPADLVIVTETVVVVEDATPAASDASNVSDLVGASPAEETAAAPSSEPGAEERQEPLQQA